LTLSVALSGCVAPKTAGVQVDAAVAAREEQIQRDMRLQRQNQQYLRVQNVAYPILKGAVPLCKENVRPSLGLMATTVHDYGKDDVAAAMRFGITERPTVIAVTTNAPADRAGIQKGDVILAINGKPVATGKKATARTMEMLTDELAANPTVTLDISRAGQPQTITATADTVCKYPVVLLQDDVVNAYADGKAIYVTSGMLRFVENDQELATVIGHELAHNAMGHLSAKTTNYVLGSIFDVLAAAYGINTQGAFGNAAAQAYSQEFEAEADYVGVYAMALGGVDIAGAANLWRRMGAESGSIRTKYNSSHPGSTERYVAIDKTVVEVNQKIVDMLPLAPNLKK
jgi:predicted Zn-dependent protease